MITLFGLTLFGSFTTSRLRAGGIIAMEPPRHSCLKLQLNSGEVFFIKGTWFTSHFDLSITDGLHAWGCSASEVEVEQRAEQWDQPVSDYIELTERYLGFQQPGSRYGFDDAGNGHKRLSWTLEKEGTKLEWRWRCQMSSDNKQVITEILSFLMESNILLSEVVLRKTQTCDKLKLEAGKCLSQSEKFCAEKIKFESAAFAKKLIGTLCICIASIVLRMETKQIELTDRPEKSSKYV